MKRKYVILIIISLFILLSFGYLSYYKYSEYREINDKKLLQEGYVAGYNNAFLIIGRYASGCQRIPVPYYNETIDLISIECLQQQAGSQNNG